MMAGRAAMGRQGYSDAIGYFTQFDERHELSAGPRRAGVVRLRRRADARNSSDTNNPLANFGQAIQVFKAICQTYPQIRTGRAGLGRDGRLLFAARRATAGGAFLR